MLEKFSFSKSAGKSNLRSPKIILFFASMLKINSNSLVFINFAKEELISTL